MRRTNPQTLKAIIPKAGRVAAIQHDRSGGLAVIIAETGGGSITVVEEHRTDIAHISELLRAQRVDLIVRLVPSSETICRVLALPAVESSDRTELADALGLMAESELPSSLPWYRRAAGVVRLGPAPSALLTGWTPPEGEAKNDRLPLSAVPEVWTAEIAALDALGAAINAGPLIGLADSKSGTLALLAAGPKRTLARVLRLTPGEGWSAGAQSAWHETAAAAGLEETRAPGTDGLLLPLAGTTRLGGAMRDREWIARYGLAFGAIALYADPDAAVSSLVALAAQEPRNRQPLVQRTIDWLALPRHAVVVGAACIAVALLSPLVSAKARHAVLSQRAGSAESLDTRLADAERRIGFYRLLGEKRWPMTKLLSQIAGAAPVGVTLDTVELPQGETVTIRATASSSELVSTFRKNLSDTRVFTSVATPNIETTSEGVTFQLQARVAQHFALQASKPLDDFAAKTLAQRLYGEGASNTARDDREEDPSDRGSDRRTETRDSRRDESTRSGERASGPAPSPPAASEIPPPISDEEIAKLDWGAAMREFGRRRRASTLPGIDAETKARLAAESEKARARMQEAAPASSGGGS